MNNHLGNMCFNYFYINVHVKKFLNSHPSQKIIHNSIQDYENKV